MPFDPIWQFLEYPITHYEFEVKEDSNILKNKYFSFRDSLSLLGSLSNIKRVHQSNTLIKKYGVTNKHTKQYLERNEELIEFFTHKAFLEEYNLINTDISSIRNKLNVVITQSNLVLESVNRGFKKPKLNDAEIRRLIDDNLYEYNLVNDLLNKAKQKVDDLQYEGKYQARGEHIEKCKERFYQNTSEIELKIKEINTLINRNEDYVIRYLKVWKSFRSFVKY